MICGSGGESASFPQRSHLLYHFTMSTSKEKNDGPSLLPPEKAIPENEERSKYIGTLSMVALVIGPTIALLLYAALTYLFHSEASNALLTRKFQFLVEYQLYYVYIAVYIVYVTSLVEAMNANGARGPTCLDRPDQHVYQVVGKADLVLLATDGVYGRFNRAQRASFHRQESLAQFLANTLLVSVILGPIAALFLAPLYLYGRTVFMHGYKRTAEGRMGGLFLAFIAEHGMAALVLLIIIKTLLGSKFPL